jgi:cholesterol transport system auxiliary component
MNVRWSGIYVAVALSSLSCGVMTKGEALSIRYFTPTAASVQTKPEHAPTAPLELRVGSLRAAAHLEERMAYRPSAAELGYLEDRRWTEPPEEFLRRALDAALFESRRIVRVYTDAAPSLDLELASFEELRYGEPRVRVVLSAVLRDQKRSLFEETLVAEEPLSVQGDDRSPAVAHALAAALKRAVAELAEHVSTELERTRAARLETETQP